MFKADRRLLLVALGAGLLSAAASAQESTNTIGPPQLRDFRLTPTQTIVTQPNPNTPPVQVAPPPPTQRQPAPGQAARPQPTPPAQRTPEPAARTQPASPTTETESPTVQPQPQPAQPAPSLVTPIPVETGPAAEAQPAPAAPPSQATPWWLYAIPVALLALAGIFWLRRRRPIEEEEPLALEAALAAPVAPPSPRREPVPRPWLELELKTERATFTETEAVIVFELSISNTGGTLASNLRIDVKMFNAGREQDKEIGAFFKTAGRQSTKLNLPGIGPNSTGIIRGEVAMPLEEMRAVKLDGRTLFIPVVAVNALYDWEGERTGHTARSYVIGRELQESAEKMGAFRVDQGPRVWRTVGARPHTLAKRV